MTLRHGIPPVTTALLTAAAAVAGSSPALARGSQGARHSWCGTYPGHTASAIYAHQEQEARLGRPVHAAGARAVAADTGQIAVLKDDGDLILEQHFCSLQGGGLEFRTGPGAASSARVD